MEEIQLTYSSKLHLRTKGLLCFHKVCHAGSPVQQIQDSRIGSRDTWKTQQRLQIQNLSISHDCHHRKLYALCFLDEYHDGLHSTNGNVELQKANFSLLFLLNVLQNIFSVIFYQGECLHRGIRRSLQNSPLR